MADLDIAIAGRSYRVACADGEEENLTEAARLVAAEAESLREQFGTRFAALPETRMLLMASLMLGDRFRAHLAEEAAAFAEAPEAEPGPGSAGPSQSGFFDDPVQSARIAELETALAAARDGEQAALAALEEAAERIRALAGEIAEGEPLEEDEEDLDALDEAFEDEAEDGAATPADAAFGDPAGDDAPEAAFDDASELEPDPDDLDPEDLDPEDPELDAEDLPGDRDPLDTRT